MQFKQYEQRIRAFNLSQLDTEDWQVHVTDFVNDVKAYRPSYIKSIHEELSEEEMEALATAFTLGLADVYDKVGKVDLALRRKIGALIGLPKVSRRINILFNKAFIVDRAILELESDQLNAVLTTMHLAHLAEVVPVEDWLEVVTVLEPFV